MSIYRKITKHRKFNEPLPYTYVIVDTETNQKYYGVRFANVKQSRSPNNDLGIYYFSSSISLKKQARRNKERFLFIVRWTFDSIEDAIAYEQLVVKRIIHQSQWINQNAYPMFANSVGPNKGRPVSAERRAKTSEAGRDRKGYNDGVRNYLLKPDDPRIPQSHSWISTIL